MKKLFVTLLLLTASITTFSQEVEWGFYNGWRHAIGHNWELWGYSFGIYGDIIIDYDRDEDSFTLQGEGFFGFEENEEEIEIMIEYIGDKGEVVDKATITLIVDEQGDPRGRFWRGDLDNGEGAKFLKYLMHENGEVGFYSNIIKCFKDGDAEYYSNDYKGVHFIPSDAEAIRIPCIKRIEWKYIPNNERDYDYFQGEFEHL